MDPLTPIIRYLPRSWCVSVAASVEFFEQKVSPWGEEGRLIPWGQPLTLPPGPWDPLPEWEGHTSHPGIISYRLGLRLWWELLGPSAPDPRTGEGFPQLPRGAPPLLMSYWRGALCPLPTVRDTPLHPPHPLIIAGYKFSAYGGGGDPLRLRGMASGTSHTDGKKEQQALVPRPPVKPSIRVIGPKKYNRTVDWLTAWIKRSPKDVLDKVLHELYGKEGTPSPPSVDTVTLAVTPTRDGTLASPCTHSLHIPHLKSRKLLGVLLETLGDPHSSL